MILRRSLTAYMDQDAQKEERSVDEAIDAMKSRNDTQAVLFTCMFGENAYDYPSAYFRDSLLQLNPKNEDAQFICFTLSSESILKQNHGYSTALLTNKIIAKVPWSLNQSRLFRLLRQRNSLLFL